MITTTVLKTSKFITFASKKDDRKYMNITQWRCPIPLKTPQNNSSVTWIVGGA